MRSRDEKKIIGKYGGDRRGCESRSWGSDRKKIKKKKKKRESESEREIERENKGSWGY